MSTHTTAQTYETRLAALVDNRMAAGTALAGAAAERDARRAAFDEAEANYAAAYADAMAAGWSESELRKAGLDAATGRAAKAARRGRPARSARTTTEQSALEPTPEPAATSDAQPATPES